MIIRTKSREYRAGDVSVLLDFLGVKKEAVGSHKVSGDVELIASVPFMLAADSAMNSEQLAMSNEKEGFAWVLSSFDLDRFGERIDPAGWDIRAYLENPVVEWAHNFLIPAIGKIESLNADDKGLHGVVVFNGKEYDAFGWGIGQRVKSGVIRAGSVGFRPLEIEIPSKEDGKDGTCLIFRKQELVEFSICNVPANPRALADKSEQVTGNRENASQFWGSLINFNEV